MWTSSESVCFKFFWENLSFSILYLYRKNNIINMIIIIPNIIIPVLIKSLFIILFISSVVGSSTEVLLDPEAMPAFQLLSLDMDFLPISILVKLNIIKTTIITHNVIKIVIINVLVDSIIFFILFKQITKI